MMVVERLNKDIAQSCYGAELRTTVIGSQKRSQLQKDAGMSIRRPWASLNAPCPIKETGFVIAKWGLHC